MFTADRGSKRVTAIDARTGKIAGVIDGLGGRTEHLAADGAGHVFLNMQDRHTVLRLDSQALKVLDTWPLTGCQQPSSMDMDRKNERVFIGCRSGVMTVVDGNTGKIVDTQPIGRGVDATEFDPEKGLVFFSTGGGNGALSVFHQDSPDKYMLVEEVKTQAGARTMALDRKDRKSISVRCAVRASARAYTSESTAAAGDDPRHIFSTGVRKIATGAPRPIGARQ